jgi:IS5 family transposase
MMFKVLLLQSWHNLSDAEMEYALCDRFSFARFAGFSLEDETPDHTTICRFRNLLIDNKLLRKLPDEVNRQLEHQGKLVRKGCIVDATIISSSAHPAKRVDIESVPEDRKEDEVSVTVSYSHDTGAAWTKKGNKYHYGYKAHVATDSKHGFVLCAHVTPANRADTAELAEVLDLAGMPARQGTHLSSEAAQSPDQRQTRHC